MYNVRFNSENNAFAPVIIKGVPAGYCLLEVAVESGISLQHKCGMVCCCNTCMVYINTGEHHLETASVREQEFIDTADISNGSPRLGCQSILKEFNHEGYLEVTIPIQPSFA
jgi:2Fe-2S ferredoxin